MNTTQMFLLVALVVCVTLTGYTSAQGTRCYNCTGLTGDPCTQTGDLFRGINIPLINCTTGCSKTEVKTGSIVSSTIRFCGTGINGRTCSKSGGTEICVTNCIKDFCNDSDVPRYTSLIILATFLLAGLAKYLQ